MDLLSLIKTVADSKITFILNYGYAKAGCNGPYQNKDTAVRNSGHWLITYSYLYYKTGDVKYYRAVEKLAEFLMNEENYSSHSSVCCRKDIRFDHTNGLIGQAWTVEALIAAADFLKDNKYYHKAKKLFKVHPFDVDSGLWEITDCDGSRDYDSTYNHQLWFAASGSMILAYEKRHGLDSTDLIEFEIKRFLDMSFQIYFQTNVSGRIVHKFDYPLTDEQKKYRKDLNRKRKTRSLLCDPVGTFHRKLKNRMSEHISDEKFEDAYQLFNLYGFALLKKEFGKHEIFTSEKLNRALSYALDTNKLLELRNNCGREPFNQYAFGYNSPAFEYPYVSMVFRDDIDRDFFNNLYNFQIENTFDKNTFAKNCKDPETLDARIYELTRFLTLCRNKICESEKGLKICFLTDSIAYFGGRQRINVVLANALSEISQYDISLLCTDEEKIASRYAYKLDSKVRTLWEKDLVVGKRSLPFKAIRFINKYIYGFKNVRLLKYVYFPPFEVKRYNRYFKRNPFDIVIGVGTRPSAMLALLDDSSRKIGWFHCSYETYFEKKNSFQWRQEKLYKYLFNKLDRMVVLTENEIECFKNKMGYHPVRIYNPLTVSCRQNKDICEKRAIFVGRLEYGIKGLDLLVQIAAIVRRRIADFTLIVVGDGDEKDKMRLVKDIQRNNLEAAVILVGAQENVVDYYCDASVAILTSRLEGFGLVVTEAMECGLPVISFKTEGPSEIIQDGVNGYLIDNYNIGMFAEKLISILTNEELRREMSRNATYRAKDFSVDVIVHEWDNLFFSIK